MRFLDIFVICILCDDDYIDIVESVGVLYKVYWCVYMYYMEMNIIIMLIVWFIVDSDVYVIVKFVIVIYVIIVVYVDNSVWMVLMCNVCLLIVYCICV